MKSITNIKLRFVFALFTVLLLASLLGAQTPAPPKDQTTSLADYARKVHKDPGAAQARPKVFDNDNLPKTDKLSVVGQPAPVETSAVSATDSSDKPATASDSKAASDSKTPADAKAVTENKAAAPAKPASEEEQAKKQAEWKAWQDRITAQKDQITLATRELDVTQREYQLRAAAMYADVGNRLRNEGSWDKEDTAYKQKIADKQKALDDAKQKLDDMREEAHKAGVPSSMSE
jgi:hypothetical protein